MYLKEKKIYQRRVRRRLKSEINFIIKSFLNMIIYITVFKRKSDTNTAGQDEHKHSKVVGTEISKSI